MKKQQKTKDKKKKNVKKRGFDVTELNTKTKTIISLVAIMLILVTIIVRDVSLEDSLRFALLLYITIATLFYKEIQKYAVLSVIKIWTNVLVFFGYGFTFATGNLVFDIFVIVLMFYIIIRNAIAFYKSVELAHIRTSLAIAIANILQLIIAYGLIYRLIYTHIPNSFRFEVLAQTDAEILFDLIYFSFTTFTTLGYGDIVPLHFVSKIVVITEVALFLFLLTVSIIFITSKKNNGKQNRK